MNLRHRPDRSCRWDLSEVDCAFQHARTSVRDLLIPGPGSARPVVEPQVLQRINNVGIRVRAVRIESVVVLAVTDLLHPVLKQTRTAVSRLHWDTRNIGGASRAVACADWQVKGIDRKEVGG